MQLTQRFDSLERIRERIREEHGESARIIGIEKIAKRGILGGRTEYYDATIEVPDPTISVADRVGIAALLDDADGSDATDLSSPNPAKTAAEFDALIRRLTEDTSPAAAPERPSQRVEEPVQRGEEAPQAPSRNPVAPPQRVEEATERPSRNPVPPRDDRPATRNPALPPFRFPQLREETVSWAAEPIVEPEPPAASAASSAVARVNRVTAEAGQLVLVVGFPETVALGATALLSGLTAQLRPAGRVDVPGIPGVVDRRSAIAARWNAVNAGAVAAVALGIEPGDDVAELVRAMSPDQVWAHVPAGARAEDVEQLLASVREAAPVAGLSVYDAARTRDPLALSSLGIPVAYVDGRHVDER